MAKALFPGSFDPPTNGHLDLVRRAAAMFDGVVVAVAENPEKRRLFSVSERLEMLREVSDGIPGVEIRSYEGLTVSAAKAHGCTVLFRGLRSVSDLEYETPMAQTNRHLAPDIDTVFVVPAAEWQVCSSRLVREAAALGGDVSHFVPPGVWNRLQERVQGEAQ